MEDKCKCIEELTTLEEVQVMSISGTTDYTELINKPQINGHELQAGDNTLDDLGIQTKGDYVTTEVADGKYATKGEIPDVKDFITEANVNTKLENYYTKQDIDGKGYLTEHQDISNLATKAEVDLKADKTALDNYYDKDTTNSMITPKADKTYVDTNFVKKPEIADFIKKDVTGLENYYDKTAIDTKTEDFITKTVSNLANYYLKTETYNQTEIDQKISTVVSGGFKKVDQLPETGESKYIYLVPAEKTFSQNIKNEFIWLDDEQAFEQIGSTQLDLEPYATTEVLNQKLQDYATKAELSEYYKKADTYSSTQVDSKVDEETRDLLKTLSRELKPDEEDENGYSAQTLVNVKNKSDATELIVEIDNLDVKTNVAVNSVLGTLKGQDLEDRLKVVEGAGYITNEVADLVNYYDKKAVDDKQIPVIEMEATISQDDLKAYKLPELSLNEEQQKTIVNNNATLLKVKYNVTKDTGTETVTMVFYTTIDNVESSSSSATAKTIKINAIRTNDEGDIVYHAELLGNGETFAPSINLTAYYFKHTKNLSDLSNDLFVKCNDEEDAKSKSTGDTKHLYYWVEEE